MIFLLTLTMCGIVGAAQAVAAPLQDWIDPTFAASGSVVFPGEGDDFAATAVDASGRTIIATRTSWFIEDARLRRLSPDGTIDDTFGGGTLNLPALPAQIHADTQGTVTLADAPAAGGVRIHRLTSAGTPELSFGSGGTLMVLEGRNIAFVFAITERANGGLVLAALDQSSYPRRAFLIAVTGFGALDTSWAPGSATPGILELIGQSINDIAADGDHVVALGLTDGSRDNWSIQRYTPTGNVDSTFATGGRHTFPYGFAPRTITATAEAYLVGGSSAEPDVLGTAMAVYRILNSGMVDTGFGNQGKAVGPVEECSLSGRSVHTTPSFIYVIGRRGDCGASPVFINRFTTAGVIDSSYGEGGELVIDAVAGRHVLGGHGITVLADDRALIYFDAHLEGSDVYDAGIVRMQANVTGNPTLPFTGFFQPVDNPPTLNLMKAGTAAPVKFALGDDLGLDVMHPGYPASLRINCDTEAPIDGMEETSTAGNSGLQYDLASGQYLYIWKTEKTWKNTCRQFILRLRDGTTHTTNFMFN